jgi:hypothetical protein
VIDPNNSNTAYVTFSYYAPAGQGVWKTTNLNAATPTWTAAGTGIPSVPVNAFVVDPNNSSNLFAGTDIGVYGSTDGGTTWSPYGTGLPAVAVFDMKIVQPGTSNESLRVATHGRSMWQIPLWSPPGYQRPQTASHTQVSLVPVFKQCGTGGNPVNSSHPPGYLSTSAIGSCNPPQPQSSTAVVGAGGSGVVVLDVGSGPSSSDVTLIIVDSDIQTPSGGDYLTGPLKMVFRTRLTDLNNCTPSPCGGPFTQAGTGTDSDFGPVPVPCIPNGPTSTPPGSNCIVTTSANSFMPGLVVSGKQAVWQAFRIRMLDNSNTLFQQQGFLVP